MTMIGESMQADGMKQEQRYRGRIKKGEGRRAAGPVTLRDQQQEALLKKQIHSISSSDKLAALQGKPTTGKHKPPSDRDMTEFDAANPTGRVGQKIFSVKQARKAIQDYDILPLDYFLSLLNMDGVSVSTKIECAKAAAPYVHRKMPIGIDNGAGGPISLITPAQLSLLSNSDLAALEAIMTRMAMVTAPGTMTSIAAVVAIDEAGQDEDQS
jgi:hypothetical protein